MSDISGINQSVSNTQNSVQDVVDTNKPVNLGTDKWQQKQLEVSNSYNTATTLQEIDKIYQQQKQQLTNENAPQQALGEAKMEHEIATIAFNRR